MYTEFFGFRELPFNNTPDPRFFFSTPDHDEALASLIYAVTQRKGFVLLTGEVGAGKTLVTRMMLRHFGTQIAFANVNHAVTSADDLMESICTEFELPVDRDASGTQLVRLLHDFLLAQFAQNTPVVLVLDEAQNLPAEGFERLRMIGNLEADDAKLLQIAVVGQPELQRRFGSTGFRQLRQRIFRSFHLPALGRDATKAYIRHRLSVVSDTPDDVFEADALEAIYRISRGLPRLINTVCDNALLSAYSADRRRIDGPFVDSVAAQMMFAGDGPQDRLHRTNHESSSPRPELVAVGSQIEHPAESPVETAPAAEPAACESAGAVEVAPTGAGKQIAVHPSAGQTGAGNELAERGASPTERTESAQSSVNVGSELVRLKREIHETIRDEMRRVDAIERRLKGTSGELADARAVYASLEPLVEQARHVLDRADCETRGLAQRQRQLQTLNDTVRGVVTDLRTLLDRTARAAAVARDAERGALRACDRLASQSARTNELFGQLSRLSRRSNVQARFSTPNQQAESARPPSHSIIDAEVSSSRHDRDRMMSSLHTVRESLAGLRGLAHDAHVGIAKGKTGPILEVEPATRLSHRVKGLIEMIEPAGTGSANKPV